MSHKPAVSEMSALFKKYDVPVPRYTSYPTVPFWNDSPTTEQWLESLERALKPEASSWALYLHIPFCETLCTFCGCNTIITKGHDREQPYVDVILKEWELYLKRLPQLAQKSLRQLHLGGGTPTFLSPKNLDKLVKGILNQVVRDPHHFEGSFEVDPRRTSAEQMQCLRENGFTRVSLGVQDFDPEVQRLVNRVQPYDQTESMVKIARELKFESINFDLIYGLPKQSPESFSHSIDLTLNLLPERIALYSLAVVPWIKPAQRLFKDEDLPQGEAKRQLYELAREKFLQAGYFEIGMDHFALPSDALKKSRDAGQLHRNFMGYTDMRTDVLLGLGVSSISETPDCFHQNEKVLPVYERQVNSGQFPTFRGHRLSAEDREQREQVLRFMTQGHVHLKSEQIDDVRQFLKQMIQDGLVQVEHDELRLTAKGSPFLRNACVALDQRLRTQKPDTQIFSRAL